MQGKFNNLKTVNMICHISQVKDKNYMMISVDGGKAFEKNYCVLMKKIQPKYRENVSQHNKDHI